MSNNKPQMSLVFQKCSQIEYVQVISEVFC